MSTSAPLGSVRIVRVVISLDHSAVVMLVDESAGLDKWLWGTNKIHRGRATGKRFRLTIDGVTMDARRVFAKFYHDRPGMFVTVTSWPGETAAAAFGRKVGKPIHEIELVRVAASRKQGELKVKAASSKRVTVEVESAAARG